MIFNVPRLSQLVSGNVSCSPSNGMIRESQNEGEDERWCEEVAQLLLEEKKGEEVAAAVKDLDSRSGVRKGTPGAGVAFVHHQQHHQQHSLRMSSSVPLPNDCYPAFSGIILHQETVN